MKKIILIVLAVAAVIVGGAMLKKDNKEVASASPTKHTFGEGKSGVLVEEFGDFQCPGCGGFYPIIKQIKEKYKDDITFQFIHFPLSQIHQNAIPAHRAAEAASNQGKFWEMHDLLYENQNSWSASANITRDLESYATQLNLDMTKYRADYASAVTNSIIQADVKKGQERKLTGTPSIFIDGKQIEDNNSIATLEKFSAAIDAAIAAKKGQQATPANTEPAKSE